MNAEEILFYEELQSNAFPALQTVLYDGWSVRFGGGFTYRVNCANPMYHERLDAAEKIPYVEALYRRSGLSMAIFKLHDGMERSQREKCSALLDALGYDTERDGNVYVCDLDRFSAAPQAQVTIQETVDDAWLDGLLSMNGTAGAQRQAACKMLKNIPCGVAAASILESGAIVACGLGVLERGNVGLYDIFVDERRRRCGLGRDICTALMNCGKAHGCHRSYLQVLSDNAAARAMYRQMGYDETYEYWFRLKRF